MTTWRETAEQEPDRSDASEADPLALAAEAQTLLQSPLHVDEISLMTNRRLAGVVGELARLARAADCALAAVLAEQVDRLGFSASGSRRVVAEEFMSLDGSADVEARRRIDLAADLRAVPQVFAAYAERLIGIGAARRISAFILRYGELLTDQAREQCAEVLIGRPRWGRTRMLTKALELLEEALADQHTPPCDDVARNSLHLSKTFGGRYRLDADVDESTGDTLRTLLDLFNVPVPRPDGTRDRRTKGQRDGAAMAELCRRLGEQVPLVDPEDAAAAPSNARRRPGGLIRGARAMFVITLADALSPRPGPELRRSLLDRGAFAEYLAATTAGRTPGHTPMRWAQMRRITCDCVRAVALTDRAGAPLTVDSDTRLATDDQRIALRVRDHGCAFPGCERPFSWTQAHHIRHWIDGGPTSIDNLVALCAAHHRAVHADWEVAMGPDRLPRFRPPESYDPDRVWVTAQGRACPDLNETQLLFRDLPQRPDESSAPAVDAQTVVRERIFEEILDLKRAPGRTGPTRGRPRTSSITWFRPCRHIPGSPAPPEEPRFIYE